MSNMLMKANASEWLADVPLHTARPLSVARAGVTPLTCTPVAEVTGGVITAAGVEGVKAAAEDDGGLPPPTADVLPPDDFR